PLLDRCKTEGNVSAARASVGEGGKEAWQRKQRANGPQLGNPLTHLRDTFGGLASSGQRVTAKDLADRYHRSKSILVAISSHPLTSLPCAQRLPPQLVEDPCGPQRDRNRKRMRQRLSQRESIATQRQRLLGAAELTQRQRPEDAAAHAGIVARVSIGQMMVTLPFIAGDALFR